MTRGPQPNSTRSVEARMRVLYNKATQKLLALGIVDYDVRLHRIIMRHVAAHMGVETWESDEALLREFLAIDAPDSKPAEVPGPRTFTPGREYKLDTAMQLAARKARAEQPEMVTVTGRKQYIDLGA